MKYFLVALFLALASPVRAACSAGTALAIIPICVLGGPASAECASGYTPVSAVSICVPNGSGVTAIPANTFLGSLGMNIHISQGFSEAAYEPEFTFTGVRNARDYYTSTSLVNLHNNTASSTYPGVKMDILADAPSTIVSEGTTLNTAGAFMGAEGPNEPNNFSITYGGNAGGDRITWVPVAQFQRDLDTAMKGSSLSAFPVFNVSETGGEFNNVGLQCLVLNSSCAGASAVTLMAANTAYADYANVHNYVQGNGSCGVFSSRVANQAWQAMDQLLNSCWDGFYGDQIVTWSGHFNGYSTGQAPGVPRISSETGWDSSTTGSTVDYQGKIIELTYLDGYKRGNAWTFIYEMVDAQGSTGNQGLYDSNNVAKLGATYLHNLTTILQDTGNFTPGSLVYSIASEPSTVHDMLLQKVNGDFYLVIWDEQTTSGTTDSITVTLGSAANVAMFDTTLGTSPVSFTAGTSSIPLTLSDHAVILQISAAPLAPAFYVSTTGNDSNAGTLASPFLTLHQCKVSMEASGTKKTCYVRGGSYAPAAADASICNGTTTCAVGMSSAAGDNNLTFSYYPPDGYDSADITGGATSDSTGLYDIFFVGNTTGVTINGLNLHHFRYAGISSGGGNHTLTVTNNIVSNGFCVVNSGNCTSTQNEAAIQCYGCTGATITNNVVHDMASFGIAFTNANGDLNNLDIENNVVYQTCVSLQDCGAIYVDDLAQTSTNKRIKNNYVHDGAVFDAAISGWGAAIYMDDCDSNNTVTGNVLTGKNGGNNIMIHGGSHNVVSGNLIDLATLGMPILREQSSSCSTVTGNSFKNNIVISNGAAGGYTGTSGTVTVANNAYHNYGSGTLSTSGDSSPVSEDPSLTCWAYTLGAGSLAATPPVTFSGIPGVWGYPGFTLPHTGTVPSSPHTC